jgi:DNA invertase Pin-like site-specific DNA recombinase
MTYDGFVASDWVQVLETGLDKSSACVIEQNLIRELKPTYNKPLGRHLLKLTPEHYILCEELRASGLSYYAIAEEIGLSTMTVYRALNGQTKNIGEDYAE